MNTFKLVGILLCILTTPLIYANENLTSRSFQMGFSTVPLVSPEVTYEMLKSFSDIVSHSFQDGAPWNEALLSSDYKTYPEHLKSHWLYLDLLDKTHIPDHPKYIVINPIDSHTFLGLAPEWGETEHLPLDPPWNNYAFNHPDVKKAFLNYMIAVVDFFQPKYLSLNMETNILLADAPTLWNDYKELNVYIYTELKARFPNLILVSSIQYEHLEGLHFNSRDLAQQIETSYPNVLVEEVKVLLQYCDLLGVSTFPFIVEENEVTPKQMKWADPLQLSKQG